MAGAPGAGRDPLEAAAGAPHRAPRAGRLVLDRARSRVLCDAAATPLTAKEFGLLEYLVLHADRVVSRVTLAEHVWDNGYPARSNVVEATVVRLWRKLEDAGEERLIETVKGLGYRLRRAGGSRTSVGG